MNTSQSQNEPMLVDAPGACRLLGGISERKLHSMKQSGEIPHVRIGRRVLYSIAALQEWIDAQTQGGVE